MTTGEPEEWAVLQLLTQIPLPVAATVMRVVAEGLEAQGWQVFVKSETGAGCIWIRRD